MYFSEIIVIFLVICNYGVVSGVDPCPTEAELAGCTCHPVSLQIRCDGPTIKQIKPLPTGQWSYLYIHDTEITTLAANTFQKVQFKEIFIINNKLLENINKLAFGASNITTVLEIRNNILLKEEGLFDIAKLFAAKVTTIGYDGNKFAKFEGMNFDKSFVNLESLNLNNQQGAANLNLPKGFVSNLPKLHQLSLDFNGITIIEDGSINLTETAPLKKRVSIFLNDNTIIVLTDTQIILPKPEISVGLVIGRNHIKELTVKNINLLVAIATNGGSVFLDGNKIDTCDCNTAGRLRKKGIWEKFLGLSTIVCGSNGKLADCNSN